MEEANGKTGLGELLPDSAGGFRLVPVENRRLGPAFGGQGVAISAKNLFSRNRDEALFPECFKEGRAVNLPAS